MNWIMCILIIVVGGSIGWNRKRHHSNLEHVWLVGLGQRALDDRARKLLRCRVYDDKYLEGVRRQCSRRSMSTELYGRPKRIVRTDIFGLPIKQP